MIRLVILCCLSILCFAGIIVYTVRYYQAPNADECNKELSGVITALTTTTITISVLLDGLDVHYPVFMALGGCVFLSLLFYSFVYKKSSKKEENC